MYRRELEGRVLSFGHAGILYQSSFVMYDRQTKSLWVHVTGRAHAGPLTGKQLTFMPSTVTSWEQWKAAHPYTKVLPGHRRGGFMGTYTGLRRGRGIGGVVGVRFTDRVCPVPAPPACIWFLNTGTTLPLLPKTFPNRTDTNRVGPV